MSHRQIKSGPVKSTPVEKRPASPATKAEVEQMRQKIVDRVEKSPEKAARIISDWLKNPRKP